MIKTTRIKTLQKELQHFASQPRYHYEYLGTKWATPYTWCFQVVDNGIVDYFFEVTAPSLDKALRIAKKAYTF